MKIKNDKLPITPRALLQRINRKLRDKGQQVIAQRGKEHVKLGPLGQDGHDVGKRFATGHYYRVAADRMLERDVDLAKLGAELDCIKGWEQLAD